MSQVQVIVCGSIAIDRIMNFPGRFIDVLHPEKLHVLSLSVLLDRLIDTPGGTGANIVSSLGLLGEKPILLGSVGQDDMAYVQALASRGVDTSAVHLSQYATASFNVITDLDDNQVGGFYPGAMSDSVALSLKPWRNQQVLVVVSAHDPAAMRSQLKDCKKYGLRLLFDPGQQVSNMSGKDLAAGLEIAEILVVNDYEMGVLCKKTNTNPEDLKAKIPVVITTYGKEGSLVEGAAVQAPLSVSTARPRQFVDTTGAGDGYRAGFLYGYARQWELLKCARLGSVVASFIVEGHGTQVVFSKEAVVNRYQQTFNEGVEL